MVIPSDLDSLDVSALERKGRDFSFTDVYRYLEEGVKLLRSLYSTPDFWQSLPPQKGNAVDNKASSFRQLIQRIIEFDPEQSKTPKQERDEIANRVIEEYAELYELIATPFMAYLAFREASSDKLSEFLTSAKQKTEASAVEVSEAVAAMQEQKLQADEILKAMREASAKTGVSRFAGVFGDQARVHKFAAISLGCNYCPIRLGNCVVSR